MGYDHVQRRSNEVSAKVSARPYHSRRRERQVLACEGLRGPADYWLTRRRSLMPPDLHSVYFDELGCPTPC